MTFRIFLTETIGELNKDRVGELESMLSPIFKKYFPNGLFQVSPTAMGDGKTFWVQGFIVKDLNDEPNRIRQNDPLRFTLNVEYLDDNNFLLTSLNQISLKSTPKKKHLVMGSNKISFRKSSGDDKKLKKSYENTVKKIRTEFDSMLSDETFYHKDIPEKYKK